MSRVAFYCDFAMIKNIQTRRHNLDIRFLQNQNHDLVLEQAHQHHSGPRLFC